MFEHFILVNVFIRNWKGRVNTVLKKSGLSENTTFYLAVLLAVTHWKIS